MVLLSGGRQRKRAVFSIVRYAGSGVLVRVANFANLVHLPFVSGIANRKCNPHSQK
jgi:hypothetical protein